MRNLLILIVFFFSYHSTAAQDTTQKIEKGRTNSSIQQKKPYVILISIDGYRHDYSEKHNATFLKKLYKNGVSAKYMLPSYPTVTFPNHYSIVTGLYPSHHGLVGNNFYDAGKNDSYAMKDSKKVGEGSWYGGTPLWVLAEQQKMLSASFFWVGSEAAIKGVRPTYWYKYNEIIPIEERIKTVVDWLQLPEDKRPHFISFYFPEVDHAGHDYGPDADKTGEAVRWVDTSIYRLTEAVKKSGLDVNYIVVSDHGMSQINVDKTLKIPAPDKEKFTTVVHSEFIQFYAKNKKDIPTVFAKLKADADGYKVYLKEEMPSRLHYGAKDDCFNRIGDIILIADPPLVFSSSSRKPKPGAHGYDNEVADMRGIFYGWGPAFKTGKVLNHIRNVDVYPIVTEILGLNISDCIDGNTRISKKVLKQ